MMRSLAREAAKWVAERLLAFSEEGEQSIEETDDTEHLPVPPQNPLTPQARAMMYTPPVRVRKPEPAPLAGSARARVEQARKRNA